MNDSNEMLEYEYDELEYESDLAWLLVMGDEKIWFPMSRCELDESRGIIEVPRWLAEEKGLE